MPVIYAVFLKKAYRKRNPNHMNDSIQNLHKRIKKEVNVEIGRGNLIECRYPEILTENRHARTSRLHRKHKNPIAPCG